MLPRLMPTANANTKCGYDAPMYCTQPPPNPKASSTSSFPPSIARWKCSQWNVHTMEWNAHDEILARWNCYKPHPRQLRIIRRHTGSLFVFVVVVVKIGCRKVNRPENALRSDRQTKKKKFCGMYNTVRSPELQKPIMPFKNLRVSKYEYYLSSLLTEKKFFFQV